MRRLCFASLLVVAAIGLLFSGCGKDNVTDPDDPALVVAPNVAVLADSLLETALVVDVDSHYIAFDTVSAPPLNFKVNDIIVSGAGTGLLKRVTAIDTIADRIIVSTEQASLTDVFTAVNISLDTVLTPSNLDSVVDHVQGIVPKVGPNSDFEFYIDVPIYDRDGDLSTESDQIQLTGNVSFSSRYDFNLSISHGELSELTFQNTVTENLEISIEAGLQQDVIDLKQPIQTYYFQPMVVWAGFVPVVLTPKIELTVGCVVTAYAKVEVGVTQQASLTSGLTYHHNAWHPIAEHNFDADPVGPSLTAGCDAKGFAGPELSLMIYGIVGPYVNVHGYAKLEADVFADPWWKLYAGIAAGAGVKMVVLNHTIADYGDDEIIGVRVLLKEAESSAEGHINGNVKDALSGSPISLANIRVLKGSEFITSGQTDGSGLYRLAVPIGDGFTVQVSKSGYLTEYYHNITISAVEEYHLEAILQVDNAHSGLGSVGGRIVNALNGAGVDDLTIRLRRGLNNRDGEIVTTGFTSGGGYYSFTGIEAGSYTAEVGGNAYITTYFTVICVGSTNTSNQNATISPLLPEGETRIVLTWGATPSDLDSHLFGPLTSGGRFHLYFPLAESNNGSLWPEYVTLDLDDVTSYGPETVTILQQVSGVYEYTVHDYTNRTSSYSHALSNSGAQVRVYIGSSLVASYHVPVDVEGTYWKVLEIDGDNITAINEMSYNSQPGNAALSDESLYKNGK